MSAVPKKTQQDKFQAVLVNLLKEEENKYCADCESKGPRWASWNLGIFLCIRCAGIHRNLGVHISRVKSVNLDSWTPEQLSVMMEIGNGKAKVAYEANLPENFRRPLTDSSLEQFIRQKYEQRKYTPTGWQPPRVNVRAELLENAPVTSLTGRGDRPSTGSKSSTGTRAARAKKDASSGIGAIPAVPSAPIGLNRIADQASDVGVGARTHTLSSSSSELSTPHNAAQPQPQAQTQPAIQGDLLVSLDDTFGDLVSAPPPQQPAMTPYFATAPATVPAPAAPAPAATTSVDDLQAVFSAPPVSYSGAPSAPSGTASESGANWSSNGNASASSMTNSAILALYGIGAAKPQNGQAFGQTSSVSPASVQQQLAGLNFGAPAASGGWPPASASGTAVRPNPFGFGIPEQTASGSGSVSTATGGGQTLISDLWH